MKTSLRYLKGTDIADDFRRDYGLQVSEEMLMDLKERVRAGIDAWGRGNRGELKNVETWQPNEDALRLKFGGKRAILKCWTCHKPNADIIKIGSVCAECRAKAEGGR